MLPSTILSLLLPLGASALPSGELEDRSVVKPCTLKTTEALRYRTCPSTSCTAIGQYSKGASVKVKCVTTGQSIHGEDGWIQNSAGYYVSIYYLTPSLDSCGAQYICPE